MEIEVNKKDIKLVKIGSLGIVTSLVTLLFVDNGLLAPRLLGLMFTFPLIVLFLIYADIFALLIVPFFTQLYLLNEKFYTRNSYKVILMLIFNFAFAMILCVLFGLDMTAILRGNIEVAALSQDWGSILLSILIYQIYLIPSALLAYWASTYFKGSDNIKHLIGLLIKIVVLPTILLNVLMLLLSFIIKK